jgi:hypothetical protein
VTRFRNFNFILGLLALPLTISTIYMIEYVIGGANLYHFLQAIGVSLVWIIGYLCGSLVWDGIKKEMGI